MIKGNIHIIIFILFLFCITNTEAQQISLYVSGYKGKVKLFSLEGTKTSLVDSIITEDGKIILSANKYNLHIGFYRFVINRNTPLNFIYDGRDVEIKTNIKNITGSLVIIKSSTNKLFYKFIKLNKAYKTKTQLLRLILARYPKDDNFYTMTQNKLTQLQYNYLKFVDTTSQKSPDSFIARYIKSSQLPVVNYNLPLSEQLSFLKVHALDNVNFKDEELIFSDLFTNKTIEYLTYYRNPQLPKALLEKEFTKAVDTLLSKAKVNNGVYEQIIQYLIDGFKQYGFENDIEYIVKNYVIKDNICLDNATESSIENIINQMKILHKNIIVPDIVMKDTTGKYVDLDKIKSNKILILFYASWCPHCKKLIPYLIKDLKNRKVKSFKILAVSLDNSRRDWINFIKKDSMFLINNNQKIWINVNSKKGWDCKAAKDYFIYATPTMFLVNKNKEIIGKPSNISKLNLLLN